MVTLRVNECKKLHPSARVKSCTRARGGLALALRARVLALTHARSHTHTHTHTRTPTRHPV